MVDEGGKSPKQATNGDGEDPKKATDKGAKASGHVTDSPPEATALIPRGDGHVTAPLSEAVINLVFPEDEESSDAVLEAAAEQVTECESSAVLTINSNISAGQCKSDHNCASYSYDLMGFEHCH